MDSLELLAIHFYVCNLTKTCIWFFTKKFFLENFVGNIIHHTESEEIGLWICLSTANIKHTRHIDEFEIRNMTCHSFFLVIIWIFLSQIIHSFYTNFTVNAFLCSSVIISYLTFRSLLALCAHIRILQCFRAELINSISKLLTLIDSFICFLTFLFASCIDHSANTINLIIYRSITFAPNKSKLKSIDKVLCNFLRFTFNLQINLKDLNLHVSYRIFQISLESPINKLSNQISLQVDSLIWSLVLRHTLIKCVNKIWVVVWTTLTFWFTLWHTE